MINLSKSSKADYLAKSIVWTKHDDAEYPYVSVVDGIPVKVRLNDFPDQSLYTLIVGGEEAADFDEWPKSWTRQEGQMAEPIARDIKEGTLTGFVGSGSVITGEATFKSMMRVDGHFLGRINSSAGTLIVGANGKVDANIEVAVAVIHGTINGDIMATQRLELHRSAKVRGNIQTPSLVIEQGAIFEGSSMMIQMSAKHHRTINASDATPAETGLVGEGFLEGFMAEIKERERHR